METVRGSEMRIEIDRKGSTEFYREVANVSMQYGRLRKKPARKLKDLYKEMRVYLIIAAVAGAFELAVQLLLGFDALGMALLGILVFIMIFSARYYASMKKYLKSMLDDSRSSTISLESEYIQIEKGSDQAIRLGWDNVDFARVFDESICFLSKETPAIIIAVDRPYISTVLEYIRGNNVDIKIID